MKFKCYERPGDGIWFMAAVSKTRLGFFVARKKTCYSVTMAKTLISLVMFIDLLQG